ncbi:gas vesicle protein [Streptomyces sp. NRRL F-4489]|uniref:GvpL/GvpF family gas vesicle protein n=1 Tax=Streptomyces sp. NRRL F-4489 TaxID=1609095 RepID=UPI00074A094B|nr:GvpL/GvpF family gas vesicle protein [Streptomyces sp. NRRL F-4489]KUL36861.1 gas vesicle protein [Streptomyces sp. NRRL F-4489]
MTVYVYSIVPAGHPQRLDGVTGIGDPPAELRTVRGGSLSAVVSDSPAEPRPKRRDIAAHQTVQERLMADGAVLPMRFGFTAADDDAVRSVLEDRADALTAQLAAVENCVEYNLKVGQEEESLLRQILNDSDEARRLNDEIRSGSSSPELPLALGELVVKEVRTRQDQLTADIVAALRRFARQEHLAQAVGDDFLNVSFLVERGSEQQFLAAEKQLAEELGEGFDVRLHGPLPVYSFV